MGGDMRTVQEIEKEQNELREMFKNIKGTACEVWSRIVGYFRPIAEWNPGKKEEFKNRINFAKGEKDGFSF